MGISLGSSFTRTAGIPLDDKMTVADNTARDAIDSGVRYQGMIVYVTATAKNWQLQGGITNGDWVDISTTGSGGSSSGDENLVTNGSGENASVSIFTAYADAAGTRPVDGTGGSPNVTTALNTTNPINGTKDYTLVKDAANRQGQGWAATVTIPLAYRAKSLKVKIKYLVTSGTFVAGNNSSSPSDGDVIWYFYDVTNSKLVEPSNIKMFSSSTTVSDMYEGSVQFDSNTASVRLIAHVASTSALAYTLQVDDVTITPNNFVYSTPMTELVAYTPTFVGFGTVTIADAYWQRLGDCVRSVGRATAGTSTGVTATISLPNNYVVSSKISVQRIAGGSFTNNSSALTFLSLANGGESVFKFGNTGASGSLSGVIGTSLVASGQVFSWDSGWIPISGLNSSLQLSEVTDSRLLYFSATKTANQSINNITATKISFDSITNDTHGFWDSGNNRYVVRTAGVYNLAGAIGWAANATGFRQVSYSINGGTAEVVSMVPSVGAGDATINGFSATTQYLNAGDYIELYGYQSSGAALNASFNLARLRISRQASPQAIALSEKVELRYTETAGQSLGTGDTTLQWLTKDRDTHAMLGSNTTVTIKTAGTYAIHAVLHVPAGSSGASTNSMKINKNGSTTTLSNYPKTYVATASDKYEVYDELNLVAGDTITIVWNNGFGVGAIPASTTVGHNKFTVHRI